MQEFSLDYESANNKKNDLGVNAFNNEKNESSESEGISIEKRTIFNDFVEEIRKTLRFYMKNNNQSFFNSFYLIGGCANIPGLGEFIASNLNVTIAEFDCFKNIETIGIRFHHAKLLRYLCLNTDTYVYPFLSLTDRVCLFQVKI